MAESGPLDLICMGRVGVDLYAEQEGARLEDVASFRKYIGGGAANICVGSARLGLRTAMLGRVGDEQMGRFIREAMAREGIDVSHLLSDPNRLTSLVTLSVREVEGFPRIFFAENAADLAVSEEDFDVDWVDSAGALLIGGTLLARSESLAAVRKATSAAKSGGAKVILDIDYRPVLWGLAGHRAGAEMFVSSAEVSTAIQSSLGDFDLVVGTEEEIRIAGGSAETQNALKAIRDATDALIVLKVGALGSLMFPNQIPKDYHDGLSHPGVEVEVFNSVGAGDAFMSGFLRGWLTDEPLERCAELANACGALVVSRHGCSPAMPSWEEIEYYVARSAKMRSPRTDPELRHLHRVATRTGDWPALHVLAFDHRWQLEEMADEHNADHGRITELKRLIGRAFERVAKGREDVGVLLDDRYAAGLLERMSGSGVWIGRAIESPRSRPVEFEGGPNVAATLATWPSDHVVKIMVYAHPEDERAIIDTQLHRLSMLDDACARSGHELLIELQSPPGAEYGDVGAAPLIEAIYGEGIRPSWWKLLPSSDARTWEIIGNTVREGDKHCRGLLVLGQTADTHELDAALAAAASEPLVRGFAIGREIFAGPAGDWFAGLMDDDTFIEEVASGYQSRIEQWEKAQ